MARFSSPRSLTSPARSVRGAVIAELPGARSERGDESAEPGPRLERGEAIGEPGEPGLGETGLEKATAPPLAAASGVTGKLSIGVQPQLVMPSVVSFCSCHTAAGDPFCSQACLRVATLGGCHLWVSGEVGLAGTAEDGVGGTLPTCDGASLVYVNSSGGGSSQFSVMGLVAISSTLSRSSRADASFCTSDCCVSTSQAP
mmetsp:Transcript_151954/g.264793  ORF Transcript_151954/g.264793 Transcript_151954/m.264793 type:complete len:200 (+) Transcript_151954:212-811(+)